jgi:hypothetical protein
MVRRRDERCRRGPAWSACRELKRSRDAQVGCKRATPGSEQPICGWPFVRFAEDCITGAADCRHGMARSTYPASQFGQRPPGGNAAAGRTEEMA